MGWLKRRQIVKEHARRRGYVRGTLIAAVGDEKPWSHGSLQDTQAEWAIQGEYMLTPTRLVWVPTMGGPREGALYRWEPIDPAVAYEVPFTAVRSFQVVGDPRIRLEVTLTMDERKMHVGFLPFNVAGPRLALVIAEVVNRFGRCLEYAGAERIH